MATAYIERGSESSPTSEQVFSFSAWVKLGDGGAASGRDMIFCQTRDGVTTDFLGFYIKETTRALHLECVSGSTTIIDLVTTQVFRDPGAWYNLAFNINMADSTTDDRAQIFVNGTRVTELDTNSIGATQNINCMDDNASNRTRIGAGDTGNTGVVYYYDGDMSHVHFVDGVAYAGSNWGSTDSTSGIWKIDPEPTVSSYGNRGFFLKMEDRTNLDLDSSPNATTLTTSGTLTATYDNPSNNFATLNPLNQPTATKVVFSNGNNTAVSQNAGSSYFGGTSTLGMVGGKWYAEFKASNLGGGGMVGINGMPGEQARQNKQVGYTTSGFAYVSDGNKYTNLTPSAYGNSYTTANVIGVAVDLDNLKIYFAKDNTWQDSGDPTSGATGTGAAFTILAASATPYGHYAFSCSDDSSASSTWDVNFGNGYFGTTAVTSAEADGAGIGAFEFAPPTGYYALCTKNIKAYGGA